MPASQTALPNSASRAIYPSIGRVGAGAVLLLAALVWSYWSTIQGLMSDWKSDQNYSVGQLVPFAALYLLWNDRERLSRCRLSTCWWGVVAIALAQGARFFGLLELYESAERYSLVLTVFGVVLLVAGRQVFWQVKWVLVFLFLMVPLPGRVHVALSSPMQELATAGAVYMLELFGTTVAREGNVILLNDTVPVAVAEQCSGLRMLTAFVVVGCVLAYVVDRPRWQKIALVVGTVPVAIICNLFRLLITARLFLAVGNEMAETFFHDFAGLTMMPIAVGLLVGALWVMAKLVTPEPSD